MKKLLKVASLVAALSPMFVLAADPLGAPKASLAPGQFAVGVEYSYAEMDLQDEPGHGYVIPIEIDNMHTGYLTVSMGATEWLEFFVRAGAITMDGETTYDMGYAVEEWDYDYDEDAIFGGGLRLTLGQVGNVTFGAVASYSYASLDGDFDVTRYYLGQVRAPDQYYDSESAWGSVKARLHQLTVGLGATWQMTENVALYGGGLIHHVRLDQSMTFEGYEEEPDRDEGGYEGLFQNDDSSTMLGGYAGVAWGFCEGMTLSVEGSLTEDTFGGSVLLGMSF